MILVGTVHIDLEGPKRLENLLFRIKPSLVSLECPKGMTEEEIRDLIMRDRREVRSIVEQSNLPAIFRQLMLEYSDIRGYDIIAPLDYCKKTGSEAIFVDHPSIFVGYSCDGLKELLEEQGKGIPEKTTKIPYDVFRKSVVAQWDRAYYDPQIFYEITKNLPQKSQEIITLGTEHLSKEGFEEEREQFMTEEVSASRPNLHIGGMAHIFEGFDLGVSVKPLYARLKDSVEERIRLCEEFLYQPTH